METSFCRRCFWPGAIQILSENASTYAVRLDDVSCPDALQSAFIVSGLGTLLQCMQIKIPGTQVRLGTGLCSFVGNSYLFGTITLTMIGYEAHFHTWLSQGLSRRLVVDEGVSPTDAYGKILGTAIACSPVFVALSFIPWRYVRLMFPPVVSGVIIILVGFACSVRGVSQCQ